MALAGVKGCDGEQCITATRRGGRWWIAPHTAVYPRQGTSPGDRRGGTRLVPQQPAFARLGGSPALLDLLPRGNQAGDAGGGPGSARKGDGDE